jgi:hypothetical protein
MRADPPGQRTKFSSEAPLGFAERLISPGAKAGPRKYWKFRIRTAEAVLHPGTSLTPITPIEFHLLCSGEVEVQHQGRTGCTAGWASAGLVLLFMVGIVDVLADREKASEVNRSVGPLAVVALVEEFSAGVGL